MSAPFQSLRRLFSDLPEIVGADIGASDLDGPPPYARWLNDPGFSLYGFEPSPDEFARLQQEEKPGVHYLPYALGDGNPAELKVCQAPGMTSLLEPDLELLSRFHGFAEWGTVIKRLPIETRRLDDLEEMKPLDYLKLDIQGSELTVLENGKRKLQDVVCLQIEVNFVPFYQDQPLFAEIDGFLREQGFLFHCFTPIISRTFLPFLVDGDIYKGINQQLWADAIYFRSFTRFEEMDLKRLLKTSLIAHDLYGSPDLAHLALSAFDRKTGESLGQAYLRSMGLV